NRMVQYQAENNGLGIDEMINVLMDKTWKAPRQNGLEGLILQQNEQLLLTYLLDVSLSTDISFATNAATKGYLLLTLERIKNRLEGKPFVPEQMPPGSPIGCDMD
ncbi:MAG: hypothetical protein ABIW34_00085, partial [Ginsengibacter sp.]